MSAPLESFPTVNANDNAGAAPDDMRHAIQEFSRAMSDGLRSLQVNMQGAEVAQREGLQRLDRMSDAFDQWDKRHAGELDARFGAMQRQFDVRLQALQQKVDTLQALQQQVDTLQTQTDEERRRLSQMSVQLAVHDQSVSTYGRTSDEVREKFSEMSRSSGGNVSKIIWSVAGAVLVVLMAFQVVEPQKLVDLIRTAEAIVSRGP